MGSVNRVEIGESESWIISQENNEANACPSLGVRILVQRWLFAAWCMAWGSDTGFMRAIFPECRIWCSPGCERSFLFTAAFGINTQVVEGCRSLARISG